MSTVRAEGRRLLELAALTGLAVVQPVLDVLGRSPETFVFRRVEGGKLIAFALALALAPALALWLVGLLGGLLGEKVRRAVHAASVGGLIALAVLVGMKSADWAFGTVAAVIALAAGAVGLFLYRRFAGVGLFLRYLSALPLLALGSFLFVSPASGLVGGGEVDIVDDPGTTTPLVMLVVDEFPTIELLGDDGQVDPERFPNFARLTQDGRWYRNYSTVNNYTLHAVPALLTGVVPDTDSVPLLADHPQNLFTMLGGTYRFNVSEAITRLCPAQLCPTELSTSTHAGLPGITEDALDVVRELVSLDDFPGPESDFFVEEVTSPSDATFQHGRDVEVQPTRFRDFLTGLAPAAEPSLHYLHMVLPHEPWRFFPDGTEYRSPGGDPRGDPLGQWSGPWPARFGRFRFELQARYTDALVGQMIERLQETSLWDEAVIVVVSDHGASFIPGQGRRILTDANAHELMWSTLFIRAPGLDQGVTDVNMMSLDLLPTIADLMGTEVPWPVEARSILGEDDPTGDKVYYRFSNRFFYEPDAVLHIDSVSNLDRMLTEPHPRFDADDPVRSLYRGTPHHALYGLRVDDLAVGAPLDATVTVDGLDELRQGTEGAVSAYVGGGAADPAIDDDAWVVVTVDGVVAGLSPLFVEEERDRGFATLLDPDVLSADGNDIEFFVVVEPGAPLRPVRATD